MGDAFLEGLLQQMAGWAVHPNTICPFLTNEPFAEPRLFKLCARINELMPATKLVFFTNASLLNANRLEGLLQLRNVAGVTCSLHHTTPEAYMADLGLDFGATVANIKRLCSEPRPFPITVLKVSSPVERENQAFRDFCALHFPTAACLIATRWNWKGTLTTHDREFALAQRCPRLDHLTVLSTGVVSLCCMDNAGEYPLGDAKTTFLQDIFNGPARIAYATRKKFESVPCNNCNMR